METQIETKKAKKKEEKESADERKKIEQKGTNFR